MLCAGKAMVPSSPETTARLVDTPRSPLLRSRRRTAGVPVGVWSRGRLSVPRERRKSGGPLAQLAEQLTLNQPVRGSSPRGLTKCIGLEGRGEPDGIDKARRPDDVANGEVSESVDEHDLGSCAARRGSSNLLFPTTRMASVMEYG